MKPATASQGVPRAVSWAAVVLLTAAATATAQTSAGRSSSRADGHAPTIHLVSARPGRSGAAKFAWRTRGRVRHTTCRLDAGRVHRCAGPVRYRRLAPGHHALRVCASNVAGSACLHLRWLVATAVGTTVQASPANRAVFLSWQPQGLQGTSAFAIRYRLAGTSDWTPESADDAWGHAAVTGLVNGQPYEFQVGERAAGSQDTAWSASVTATPRLSWIMLGSSMQKMVAAVPDVARAAFDSAFSFATGKPSKRNQVPAGYATTPTVKYESYARFASDVGHGVIAPEIEAVLYDPEKWDRTPMREQLDPVMYLRLFADLAHGEGYLVIAAPARDLMAVDGAVCRSKSGEDLDQATLRCNLMGNAARYADVAQVQSQVDEFDPARFSAFVNAAANQARAANPGVVFLAGLSKSPPTGVASPDVLVAAAESVRDVVAGFYLTVCTKCPGELDTAGAFLAALGGATW
jgi:hypothetical protein